MPHLEVVPFHHEVLRAWCRHRREVEQPPAAVTFDHHTDTLPAFSRAASGEQEREAWIAGFDWRSDESIENALRKLRHDEHLDLALRGGVISRSIVIAHSTENVITETLNPRIRVVADDTWPELNFLLNHPEEFRPRASRVFETGWLAARFAEAEFSPEENPGFLFDLDLDYLLTVDALSPADGTLLQTLLRTAALVTVSREEEWLRLLKLDPELSPELLLNRLRSRIAEADVPERPPA